MPVRFLSDAELARLSGWPDDVADDDLVTFFTLTSDDLGWLGSNIRIENRLGAAVQLCTLPWLGWIPDDLSGCPSAAVDRLANRLGLAGADVAGLLADYGGWEGRTRRDHRALVFDRLGWRMSGAGDRKQLDAFLLARALEHDAPGVLLQLACDWLRSERIFRPSVDTLSRRVAAARDDASAETYHRLAALLAPPRPSRLDGLLDVDDELGMTRLAWLRRGATAATPEVLKAELAKLEFLRAHGADRLDLSILPAGRRRMLAETGRRQPTRRCNAPTSTASTRFCWPRSLKPTSRSSTSWYSCWTKHWPARTPAPGMSCPSASWKEHAGRSTADGSSTRYSTSSPTRSCPTPTPDGWSVRASGCRDFRRLAGQPRSANRVITVISICWPPDTSTCGIVKLSENACGAVDVSGFCGGM